MNYNDYTIFKDIDDYSTDFNLYKSDITDI